MIDVDILIIGAGPSGSLVSAILHKNGFSVKCVDKAKFPRFVIGESLLPHCMTFLEEAGFLNAVLNASYQYKNGAAFSFKDQYTYFDFCDKFSDGFGTTFQVKRADFDKLLIDEAIKQGVNVEFDYKIDDVKFSENFVIAYSKSGDIRAKFIVDASGYGRFLPTLLNLEIKSNLSPKKAYFTHIFDNISEPLYDRNKILITTHPENRKIWYWLIPFSDGISSIGVVGEDKFLNLNLDDRQTLIKHVYDAPILKRLLNNAKWQQDVKSIKEYSKNVSKLYGDRFILLGNASEFLDPVFSSGVTIAFKSASLAAKCITKKLRNENVDFKKEYEDELMIGVDCFRSYVEGWYDGSFQDIIYTKNQNYEVKRKISSILAGYAWDKTNPFVVKSNEALHALRGYC
ncbi:NAD(P)/FAD-dependent oxidoreductase [Campylobacter sp. FMV-PI01]|uniref:NAD(P)/FAD-dependent oxidoreductase n=1 Tax=Campylobacter portucalensis TaxID=2608384 RepID=A0A6L5WKC9_9BACT|nr:NAD(P)/FAD-dependent oxidoreductase [Campylobacter portucalensis]MSN96697.1 NAD(P)/FAD-dependent oxidoreductase [Campylobacter portucalensis]